MTARLSRFAKHCAMALVVVFGVSSCSETINEGNFAIKSEETALDFLTSNPQFSKIKAIYDRVRLGRTEDASSLSSVLSARGNYTVFAPNDSAVDKCLNELGVATLEDLTYEQAQLIAQPVKRYVLIIAPGDDYRLALHRVEPGGGPCRARAYRVIYKGYPAQPVFLRGISLSAWRGRVGPVLVEWVPGGFVAVSVLSGRVHRSCADAVHFLPMARSLWYAAAAPT